jgi:hypothetical protein
MYHSKLKLLSYFTKYNAKHDFYLDYSTISKTQKIPLKVPSNKFSQRYIADMIGFACNSQIPHAKRSKV